MDAATEFVDGFIEHFGIKGMKWGIRNRAEARRARDPARYTKSVEKKANTTAFKYHLNNSVTASMRDNHIPRINRKYAKDIEAGRLRDRNSAATKRYNKDLTDAYMKELNSRLDHITDRTQTHKLTAVPVVHKGRRRDMITFEVKAKDTGKVRHADELDNVDISDFDGMIVNIRIIKDSNGVATGFELDDSIAQGEMVVGDILEHHGIKGMKWGVRKNKTSAVTVSQNPSHPLKSKRLQTKGGYTREASEDAIRARTSGQVAKKSGVQALSNAELNDYVNRLNLEQRAKRAQYDDASPPVKFVKKLIGQQGSAIVNETAKDVGSHQVRKRLVKAGLLVPSKAMKAAMVAA